MRRSWFLLCGVVLASLMTAPGRAQAQTVTPPAPSGEVTGKIINQNTGTTVTESQEVMLHIWDQGNAAINMLHAQSGADGTYLFTGVALQPQYVYGTMTVFDGVTYSSQVLPPKDGSDRLDLDVPVYETAQDPSAIQVDQMHVLFNFAEDGLETTEIYALSNSGMRTIKDAVKLDDGTTATMRYPLPGNADYVFFQPDEADRFIKFAGGFADTSPLQPGGQGDRFAVQYMVPYSQDGTFEYTAPVGIKALNFVLPQNSGVQLKGEGLAGPELVTLQAGKSYEVYALSDVRAGQALRVTLSGKPTLGGKAASTRQLSLPLGLGAGLLGLAMIGAGVWWWRKPEADGEENQRTGAASGETGLDELIAQIARLDGLHERGDLEEDWYRDERTRLLREAKDTLDRQEERSTV